MLTVTSPSSCPGPAHLNWKFISHQLSPLAPLVYCLFYLPDISPTKAQQVEHFRPVQEAFVGLSSSKLRTQLNSPFHDLSRDKNFSLSNFLQLEQMYKRFCKIFSFNLQYSRN